jgi:SAM-dependent methyltransferase
MNNSPLAREERACPVCHGRKFTPFADERIDPRQVNALTYSSRKTPEFMCLRLVQCSCCDLVYAPSPPAEDFLKTAYSEAGFDSGPEAVAAALSYAAAMTPYVERLPGRNAAVDVGAGSGPLLPWLKARGFEPVIGIEPSRAAIEAAPKEIKAMLREGMFSVDLLQENTPSLICSFMTLEHMADPKCFIDRAFQLLEVSGGLAVVVHNWRAPLNRLLGLRSPIIDIEHLQLFSPRSLRSLLERSGFESIEIHPIRNAYPLRYWLRLTPLPRPLKTALLRTLELLGLADRVIALSVGNILAFGIKPGQAG